MASSNIVVRRRAKDGTMFIVRRRGNGNEVPHLVVDGEIQ